MGFIFQTAKEFIEQPVTKPPYVVDQLVPAEGITMIFGPSSSGKSTLIWTMAQSVAKGDKFLGEYDTKQGKSLLINVDNPSFVMRNRMQEANYIPAFDLCDFPNHFNVVKFAETEPHEVERMKQIAADYPLIMIDSLGAVTTGLSLKEDWVPGMVISVLKSTFPERAIVLLHHSRKESMGQYGMNPAHREDAMGSNFWMAMVQSQIQLSVRGDHLSHMKLVKSQAAELGCEHDIFVDDTGCKVSIFDEQVEAQWLAAIQTAEQAALKTYPDWVKKRKHDKHELLAQLMNPATTGRTVRRWIERCKYKIA